MRPVPLAARLPPQGKEGLLESVMHTLIERVDELVQHPTERPRTWGNPRVSTTPTAMVIPHLVERIEALEEALREIALELQKHLDDD